MAAGLEFGVDHFPICNNIKNASALFLEFSLNAVFLFDFRCDTRSLRAIISFTAVFDQDLHCILLCTGKQLLFIQVFDASTISCPES